jgi:hypothetical protein
MTLEAKKFIQLSDQFPDFRNFMLVRGLQRRAFLKLHERDLIKRFDLKKEHQRTKQSALIDYEQMIKEKPFFVADEDYIHLSEKIKGAKFNRKR